jgi:hypothetical protein
MDPSRSVTSARRLDAQMTEKQAQAIHLTGYDAAMQYGATGIGGFSDAAQMLWSKRWRRTK